MGFSILFQTYALDLEPRITKTAAGLREQILLDFDSDSSNSSDNDKRDEAENSRRIPSHSTTNSLDTSSAANSFPTLSANRKLEPGTLKKNLPVAKKKSFNQEKLVIKKDPVRVTKKDPMRRVEKKDPLRMVEKKDPLRMMESKDPLRVVKRAKELFIKVEKMDPLRMVEKKDPLRMIESKDPVRVGKRAKELFIKVEKMDPLTVKKMLEEDPLRGVNKKKKDPLGVLKSLAKDPLGSPSEEKRDLVRVVKKDKMGPLGGEEKDSIKDKVVETKVDLLWVVEGISTGSSFNVAIPKEGQGRTRIPVVVVKTEPEEVEGKKHPCHICDKLFSSRGSLYTHRRTHYGIRPFGCNHCEHTFYAKSNLKIHMKRHHIDEQARKGSRF